MGPAPVGVLVSIAAFEEAATLGVGVVRQSSRRCVASGVKMWAGFPEFDDVIAGGGEVPPRCGVTKL